ncbi:MAG: lysophospholipid acyltransferase family protein [Nitrospinae bacterium]|nr:lysophospholipid acyltransferase family protein [Nitrospinota bacterium]
MKYLIPFLGSIYIFLIGLTCRRVIIAREIEKTLLERGINPIYTFWHGRMLYFPYLYRFQNKYYILVSPSKDGEIIGNLLKLYGFSIVWGSTFKKGAAALFNLVHIVKDGGSVVLIADGSRGPAFEAQDGAVKIAKLTGRPILPMTYNANWKKVLNTWDRFVIPCPFSKIAVMYGEPVHVPADADDGVMEIKRQELEKRLKDMTEYIDNYFLKPSAGSIF